MEELELLEELVTYLGEYDNPLDLPLYNRLVVRFTELGLNTTYLLERDWPDWDSRTRLRYLWQLDDLELAELASYYPHDPKTSAAN